MGTSQAALEFRTKGIKQVFFLGGARLAPFFMTSAAAQEYTARYAVSSFDNPTWMVANTATVPPAALKGMVGIGFNPGQDVPDSQYPFPSTDAERECVGIFASAGISFETRENARVALTYCDSARLLKAAAAKISGDLNAATFSSAAQSLGNEYQPSSNFGGSAGPGRYVIAGTYRQMAYDEQCNCFTYNGPEVPFVS